MAGAVKCLGWGIQEKGTKAGVPFNLLFHCSANLPTMSEESKTFPLGASNPRAFQKSPQSWTRASCLKRPQGWTSRTNPHNFITHITELVEIGQKILRIPCPFGCQAPVRNINLQTSYKNLKFLTILGAKI